MRNTHELTGDHTPIYQEMVKRFGDPDEYYKIAHREMLEEQGADESLEDEVTPNVPDDPEDPFAEMPPKPKPPTNRKGKRHPRTPA